MRMALLQLLVVLNALPASPRLALRMFNGSYLK
ncbi:hypothetical protein SRABI118_00229 [Massilia sp. Bi118]|jgi:hypothetical protein|nr:hypothetical protein SRABI118_00229 [Massilia sp. Bi118]